MNLSTLKPAKGSTKRNKRLGRGEGSGTGGTAGRGHKGAQSRSGYKSKSGFEGGQMPLQRRVPKFGFNRPQKVVYNVINLDQIQALADTHSKSSFTIEDFIALGRMQKKEVLKVLGNGEVTSAITVEAHAFSKTATEAIEKAGGQAHTK